MSRHPRLTMPAIAIAALAAALFALRFAADRGSVDLEPGPATPTAGERIAHRAGERPGRVPHGRVGIPALDRSAPADRAGRASEAKRGRLSRGSSPSVAPPASDSRESVPFASAGFPERSAPSPPSSRSAVAAVGGSRGEEAPSLTEGADAAGFVLQIGSDVADQQALSPLIAENVTIGDDGAIAIGPDGVLAFANDGRFTGTAGEVSFDIEPAWDGDSEEDNALFQVRTPNVWENRIEIVRGAGTLRFIVTDAGGAERDVVHSIADWRAGEPHRIEAFWGGGRAVLTVDGVQVGEVEYPGEIRIPPETPIFVGSDPVGHYRGADAVLRDFTLRETAIEDQPEALDSPD